MVSECLIDTGIIFSMINKKDPDRVNGLKFAKSIKEKRIIPLITDYIVDELLTLVIRKKGIMEAIWVRDFITSEYFKFHKIEESEYDETFRIFFKYNKNRRKQKGISFTDCSNAVVSNRLGVEYIASFDTGLDVFQSKNIYRIDDPTWLS